MISLLLGCRWLHWKLFSSTPRQSQLYLADIMKCAEGNSFVWFYHWFLSESPFILLIKPSFPCDSNIGVQDANLNLWLKNKPDPSNGRKSYILPGPTQGVFSGLLSSLISLVASSVGGGKLGKRTLPVHIEASNCCKMEGLERFCTTANSKE